MDFRNSWAVSHDGKRAGELVIAERKAKTKVGSGEVDAPKVGAVIWSCDLERLGTFPALAGVDEVGRGPLAGSVVAACVMLDYSKSFIRDLNDSKKVPEKKREALFLEIKDKALAFGIGECTPEEIDLHNILGATFLAMRRAFAAMGRTPSLVLVDGNLAIPDLDYPQECLVGGDGRSAAIAAASILAKVTRDRAMVKLHERHPEYGFDRNKGYGTRDHMRALERYGLTPHHRRSFCGALQSSLFD